MKKLSIVVLLMIIFFSNTYSQSNQFSSFYIPETTGLNSVFALSEQVICVAGVNGIWRTSNAGTSFTKVYDADYISIIKFYNQVGYALVRVGLFNTNVIKSTNSGINWSLCYTTPDSITFNDLYVKSTNELYANFPGAPAGRQSELFRSIDGGLTWNSVFQINIYAFQSITGDNFGNVYISGSQLFSANDTNFNYWSYNTIPLAYPFANCLVANNKLFVGGDVWINNNFYPCISYSTDQGVNWQNYLFQDSGLCNYFNFVANSLTGYAIGCTRNSNKFWIEKTINTGDNWQNIYTTQNMMFYSIGTSTRYIYFVGNSNGQGVILKYDPLVTNIENKNTPEKFKLNQNYPNPFNPFTKINYSIAKNSVVTLRVYDISGREVQTLVNEVKKPDNYSVNFNGSNLSSGIYFYKITAGEFTETKKMILVK